DPVVLHDPLAFLVALGEECVTVAPRRLTADAHDGSVRESEDGREHAVVVGVDAPTAGDRVLRLLGGPRGFGPPTSATPTRRSRQLSYGHHGSRRPPARAPEPPMLPGEGAISPVECARMLRGWTTVSPASRSSSARSTLPATPTTRADSPSSTTACSARGSSR